MKNFFPMGARAAIFSTPYQDRDCQLFLEKFLPRRPPFTTLLVLVRYSYFCIKQTLDLPQTALRPFDTHPKWALSEFFFAHFYLPEIGSILPQKVESLASFSKRTERAGIFIFGNRYLLTQANVVAEPDFSIFTPRKNGALVDFSRRFFQKIPYQNGSGGKSIFRRHIVKDLCRFTKKNIKFIFTSIRLRGPYLATFREWPKNFESIFFILSMEVKKFCLRETCTFGTTKTGLYRGRGPAPLPHQFRIFGRQI